MTEEDRGLGGACSAGCAAGGFPSGLGWEVGLTCLRVVAAWDRCGEGLVLDLYSIVHSIHQRI